MSMAIDLAEPGDVYDFLELVRGGTGHLTAAEAVGWTPRRLRQMMSDPSFAEMVVECEERKVESIEKVAFDLAQNKNVEMIKLWLFCKGEHRGWRPPAQRQHVVTEGKVDRDDVATAVAAVRELMAAGDLNALPPPVDAEIIDGD
jgi:hypothetical protein